jgi:hypothetical protein
MTYHVDVIETDWAAGVERLAARLVLNGDGVELRDVREASWGDKLLQPIPDGFGEMVGPRQDAKYFLHLLVDRLEHGSYVRAFAPHEEQDCPLGDDLERSMKLVHQAAPANVQNVAASRLT